MSTLVAVAAGRLLPVPGRTAPVPCRVYINPHRPEAFEGAREAIDRIKAEAPIWKLQAQT